MRTIFRGKKISGVLTVLPENECSFEETIESDSLSRVRRLRRIMGFDKRRRVKSETCISDMHKFGLAYLLDQNYIEKEDIGAIVVVTLSPDYYVPTVSSILHGEFEFADDVYCVDIAQGCAGYVVGLYEAFSLLNHLPSGKKVILCTGDILNRLKENEAKTTEPTFGGDAATISIIENDLNGAHVFYNYYSDGKSGKDLIMPAGAFRYPVYSENDAYVELEDGRKGYGLGIWMDGSDVFNFIMREVPPMLEDIYEFSELTKDDVDYYFFHQPNRFILEKLADKMGIPRAKMPMKIVEEFGNSNSSTIPMAMVNGGMSKLLCGEELYRCCLAGFGSGLTWSSMILEVGKMDFCEQIISIY